MKFRLHPILLPFFAWIIYMDGFSTYALILFSLLLHELGHVIAALLNNVHVKMITIMPYGGEMIFSRQQQGNRIQQMWIAAGGPLATLLVLCFMLMIPFPQKDFFLRIQIFLLLLNLLPIIPLDGGRILALLLMKDEEIGIIPERFLLFSIVFLLGSLGILLSLLPYSLPYIGLVIFLLLQNITLFRFRKYEKVLVKIINNRLTE